MSHKDIWFENRRIMEKEIENKVVIVTGGASGIGLGIVDLFVKSGAKTVIIVDLNEKLGKNTVSDIKERYGSGKADFFNCNVTTDLESFFAYVSAKYKNIDLLVNCAGIVNAHSIKNIISVNVTALMEWTMKFYDYMRKDRSGTGGTIINIASIYGLRIIPFFPYYHASKFAVVGFSKSIGHEYNYKKSGVRVIVVCPGYTHTPLTAHLLLTDEESRDDFMKLTSSNEWQEVDSVSKGVKEVFENADSGTVWVLEGSRPPEKA